MIEFKSSGFFDTLPLTNEWIINQDASKLAAFDDTNVGTLNIKDKLQSNARLSTEMTKSTILLLLVSHLTLLDRLTTPEHLRIKGI